PDSGADVDEGDAGAHGRAAVLAGDAHDPRRRLEERVVAGLRAERAARAEGADRAVDETRVARAQLLRAEPMPLGGAGAKALHEDVGAVGEPEDRLLPARVAEVDGEGALARVRGEEHRSLAAPERRAPGPCVVAGGGRTFAPRGAERRGGGGRRRRGGGGGPAAAGHPGGGGQLPHP